MTAEVLSSPQRVYLGGGVLEIPLAESMNGEGRYGSVMLNVPPGDGAAEMPPGRPSSTLEFPGAPEGCWGVLRVILEEHSRGDAWHPGQEIALGAGYLFLTRWSGLPAIGIRPRDDGGRSWMNRGIIEELRHTRVRLVFDPDPPPDLLALEGESAPRAEQAKTKLTQRERALLAALGQAGDQYCTAAWAAWAADRASAPVRTRGLAGALLSLRDKGLARSQPFADQAGWALTGQGRIRLCQILAERLATLEGASNSVLAAYQEFLDKDEGGLEILRDSLTGLMKALADR